MEIKINDETDQLTAHDRGTLLRDLQIALSRFANEIDTVCVTTEATDGICSGGGIRCHLRADTRRHGPVIVTQDCLQAHRGLARAIRRLGHGLSRRIQHGRPRTHSTSQTSIHESA